MDSKPVVRVKRKKPTKSKKSKKSKTIKSKVGQVININIGSMRRRNYIKPNKTQQHNLIPATLIGQRSEPYDLQSLNKLQERQNKVDNLIIRQYEDLKTSQEEQANELREAKEQARRLFSVKDDMPEIYEIPLQRAISGQIGEQITEPPFVNQAEQAQTGIHIPKTPTQGVVVDDAEKAKRYVAISTRISRLRNKAEKEGTTTTPEFLNKIEELLKEREQYKTPKRKYAKSEPIIRPASESDTEEEEED